MYVPLSGLFRQVASNDLGIKTNLDPSGTKAGALPKVSVIMPLRNEAKYIRAALDSLLSSTYPADLLEFILVDGCSTDGTRQILEDYQRRHKNVTVLDNPKRIVPPALNLAIAHAQGDIVVRTDSHTIYAPDYITQCVRKLQETDAANVGGVQRGIGTDFISKAIAIATCTPFGAGDAKFRFSDREQFVDTVYLGAWWKSTLEKVGGFDESWVVNQDYELNCRIRAAGGKILLSPDIKCHYFVRPSIGKLAKQYFRYGMWKVKTVIAHPSSLRWRQLAPPMLVAATLLSLVLAPLSPAFLKLVLSTYIFASIIATLAACLRYGVKYAAILPAIYWTLHFSWGVGFWIGVIRFGLMEKLEVRS